MDKLTRSTDPNTSKIDRLRLKPTLSEQDKIELHRLKVERSARLSRNAMSMKSTTDLINKTRLQARKIKAINKAKNAVMEKERLKQEANEANLKAKRDQLNYERSQRMIKIKQERDQDRRESNEDRTKHTEDINKLRNKKR